MLQLFGNQRAISDPTKLSFTIFVLLESAMAVPIAERADECNRNACGGILDQDSFTQ